MTLTLITRLKVLSALLEQRTRQQEAVVALGSRALSGDDLGQLMSRICQTLADLLVGGPVLLLAMDARSGQVRGVAGAGQDADPLAGASLELSAGCPLAASTQATLPIVVDHLARDARFPHPGVLHALGVESGISVCLRPNGQVWGILSAWSQTRRRFTADDVTFVQALANILAAAIARHRAAVELELREQRLKTALGMARMGTWVWDMATDVVEWDEDQAALVGWTPDLGKPTGVRFLKAVHPADQPALAESLTAVREGRRAYDTAFRMRRLDDGREIWLAARGGLFVDRDGRRLMIGVNWDVTGQRATLKALQDSEMRRRVVLEAAGMGTWEWQPGNDLAVGDARLLALHALEPDQPITLGALARVIHPEDLAARAAAIEAAVAQNRPLDLEYRVLTRDGSVRWLHVNGAISPDSEGQPRMFGVARDVTERRLTEARVRATVAELDHRVKNTLATVAAIIAQTVEPPGTGDGAGPAASGDAPLGAYVQDLQGRILALARARGAQPRCLDGGGAGGPGGR